MVVLLLQLVPQMMLLLLLLQLVLQMLFLLLLVFLLLRQLAIPRRTLVRAFRTLVMMVMQVVALVLVFLMMLLWTHVLVLSLMLMQLVWTHVLVFLFVVRQHPLPMEPLEFYLSLSLLFELVDPGVLSPLVSFLSWICFVPFLSSPSSRVL